MRNLRPLLLPALLALAACGTEPSTPVAALPADLATFTVEAGHALPGRGWDGVVEAVRNAELAAQTDGRVSMIAVDVNDHVKAGDVLLRITAVEQDAGANAARAQLRAAEATAAEAEKNFQRFTALSDAQYVSKAQLDQARAGRDAAVAARNAAAAMVAQAAQQAAYTVVRAPYSGIVSGRHVELGETVAPGRPLMGVYAPEALRIEVAVPQTRADAIRRDPRAQVQLANGQQIEAKEVVVFPAADALTHSVNVRVYLPTLDPQPAPGTTAKVSFLADVVGELTAQKAGAGGMRIPASSLAQRGELTGVYVVQEGRLMLRQLRLGGRYAEQVEVISGLKVGDVVASDPVAATQAIVAQRQAAEGGRD